MLKSRLDKDHSIFDGTCNPEGPEHWFKKFLDSDADIFHQSYVIDDNPYLSPSFILSLKKEYEGTVYFDRYIMGKWRAAEGIIYRRFADDPRGFIIPHDDERLKGLSKVTVGVDFGGNKSGSAFVACGTVGNYESITVLSSELHRDLIDSDMLGERFCDFIESVEASYGSVDAAYCDNAEPILIRSLKKAARSRGLSVQIRLAKKSSVNDRIRLVCRLMSQKRFFITEQAVSVKEALMTAVYDSEGASDTRLDNGTSDIDSLDALEYSIERDAMKLIG
jgi:PBSX family phage terminase large subunit